MLKKPCIYFRLPFTNEQRQFSAKPNTCFRRQTRFSSITAPNIVYFTYGFETQSLVLSLICSLTSLVFNLRRAIHLVWIIAGTTASFLKLELGIQHEESNLPFVIPIVLRPFALCECILRCMRYKCFSLCRLFIVNQLEEYKSSK